MKLPCGVRWLVLCLSFLAFLGAGAPVRAQVEDKVCQLCHAEVKADPAVRSSHAGLSCTECHVDLLAWNPDEESDHPEKLAKVACAVCHSDQVAAAKAGVHRDCKGCHGIPHFQPLLETRTREQNAIAFSEACTKCHEPAGEEWKGSAHHSALAQGKAGAPGCVDCHGSHAIVPKTDRSSPIYPLNLPATCEKCHSGGAEAGKTAPGGERIDQYEAGVHGRALRKDGLIVSATCASCHGGHDVLPASDPKSEVARRNIPTTCGACHVGILETYLGGVHGEAFTTGSADVPVCTDCHSEHGISATDSAASHVSPKLVAETCARCHGDDEFVKSHGLKSGVRASWGSSYHGIASSLGAEGAANCASCHGFHDIFPSEDTRSPIHVANLDRTCGACHSNASAAFARVPVHSTIDAASNPVPYWVKTIYTWLVVAVIGAFVLFILLDLFGRLRLKLGWGPHETHHVDPLEWPDEDRLVAPGEKFLRMALHGRLQHAVLVSSFLLLVVTGVPVFLHDLGLMQSVIDLEGGYILRSQLHRIGAIGLIGLSLWHLAVLALSPKARRWAWSMMFRPRDVLDFAQEMNFNLGIGRWLERRALLRPLFARWPELAGVERPCRGRYGLVEKLEYGAVVWGNIVMIATGFILWRPDWFLDWMPSWTFDVSRVVHGFEATLAFLAIIIWHMYHVQMRPGLFLRNGVWFHGKMTREELRHHHPGEYLAILERRRVARAAEAAASGTPPPAAAQARKPAVAPASAPPRAPHT